MHESIKRTEQEIDAVIKAGEKFVEQHPQSVFGDDNIKPFTVFKKICEKAKQGESAEQLRRWIILKYEDEEEDERLTLENEANDIIDWLAGEHDEAPYP